MNTHFAHSQSRPQPVAGSAGYVYRGQGAGDVSDHIIDAYLKGKKDGYKDMEIELIKRGKALFNLAMSKASEITSKFIEEAQVNNITIHQFHLKIENWDNVKLLIVVKLEDYLDDKIDRLYQLASSLSNEYNDETFHWDYMITYYSDDINAEKIISDGFSHIYEHTPGSRSAQ